MTSWTRWELFFFLCCAWLFDDTNIYNRIPIISARIATFLMAILIQDDSMTEEAIKQAEEELKSQSPTKVKRAPIGLNKAESKPAVESEKGKENEPKIVAKSSPTKDDVAVCGQEGDR